MTDFSQERFNDITNLISICDAVIDDCNRKNLPKVKAEFLDELRQFDYVMFDPDAADFKSYNW